jgi:hypothetical protein
MQVDVAEGWHCIQCIFSTDANKQDNLHTTVGRNSLLFCLLNGFHSLCFGFLWSLERQHWRRLMRSFGMSAVAPSTVKCNSALPCNSATVLHKCCCGQSDRPNPIRLLTVGQGSILSALRKRGWATELSAGVGEVLSVCRTLEL